MERRKIPENAGDVSGDCLKLCPGKRSNLSGDAENNLSNLEDLYSAHMYLRDSAALNKISDFMMRYYGRKPIILMDEYDAPMQEAYLNGYWDDMVSFMGSLLNAAFKTNPYLCRGILTGVTRISKESIFSDYNNLAVITAASAEYADSFGFTQEEVRDALGEYGLEDKEEIVRAWYDGFTFGAKTDIYNPWSNINYLRTSRASAYWVNTSSNSLVGKLIREGDGNIKMAMELVKRRNASCRD